MELSVHCVNPHEKVYRGCTNMCQYFSECKAKDAKGIVEGELKTKLRYISGLGHDSETIIDEMAKEFPQLYDWEKPDFDQNKFINYIPIERTQREQEIIKWFLKWLRNQ